MFVNEQRTINEVLKWNDMGDASSTRSTKESPAKAFSKKKQAKHKTPVDRSPDRQLAAMLEIHQKRALMENFRELSGLANKQSSDEDEDEQQEQEEEEEEEQDNDNKNLKKSKNIGKQS